MKKKILTFSKQLLKTVCTLFFTAGVCSAAPINYSLESTDSTGALNVVEFDNELDEPSDPVSQIGSGSSHGYAYYFNDDTFLWSIMPSSPTVADATYYQSVLAKAGVTNYSSLTVSTVTPSVNPTYTDLGTLIYDDSLVNPTGSTIVGVSDFDLDLETMGFQFYSYYAALNSFTFDATNFTGTGLTFEDGFLTSMDFSADFQLESFGITWDGTLNFSGNTFTYDINESELVPGFGDLRIVMDRTGTLNFVIPEPTTGALLLTGIGVIAMRRRRTSLPQYQE